VDEHHRDQGEVGRVEDVLAPDAQEELARDGHHCRQHRQPGIIGPEEEAERQAGDERALGVEARKLGERRGGQLGQERRREDGHRAPRMDVEAEPRHAIDEQACQHRDLVQAGVEPWRGPERHRVAGDAPGGR
jgi:hypothetical protein